MNQLPALQSADYGVGGRIIKSLLDLDGAGNSVLNSVKKRDTADWVYRIPEGEDVASVVKELSQANNKRALPVILYSRGRGLNTLSPDQAVNVKAAMPFAEGALRSAKVDVAWFDLSYSITTIANSREEAEALMLMWYFHVSKKSKGNHKIAMSYLIGEDEYALDAFISDPTALFAADFSLPSDKIFGLKQDFTIQAPCLYGEIIDVTQAVRVGFDFKGQGYKVTPNAG